MKDKSPELRVLDRIARGTTEELHLQLPKAGTVYADGKEIKKVKSRFLRHGRKTLSVQLNEEAAKSVERHGRIRVHIRLTYITTGSRYPTVKTIPLIFGYR